MIDFKLIDSAWKKRESGRCEAAASCRKTTALPGFPTVPLTLGLRCREAAVAKTMPLRTIFLSGDWVPLRLAP